MDKDSFIALLKDASYWEDEFILKYDDESFWELLQSLPEGIFKKLKPLLEQNLADTRYHQRTMRQLQEDVKHGKYTV